MIDSSCGKEAQDRHARNIAIWNAAQIVRESKCRTVSRSTAQLPFPRATQQLQVNFIRHAQAGGTDRMTETFQAAVNLTGDRTVAIVATIEHIVRRASHIGQPQVLHEHEFRNRETIVDFDQVDLFPRVLDARLSICSLSRERSCQRMAAVP